jgi:uncharacterized protein (UPF0333 family)
MFKKIKNKKAQGSLEYLLLIAGALVIAVAIIVLITSMNSNRSEDIKEQEKSYSKLIDDTIIPPIIKDVTCDASSDEVVLNVSPSVTNGVKEYCLVIDGDVFDYGVCDTLSSSNQLSFNNSAIDIDEDEDYSVSLVAKKNNYYSTQTKPSMSCTGE